MSGHSKHGYESNKWPISSAAIQLLLFVLFLSGLTHAIKSSADQSNHEGYIIYCPCMGRFGNQAEQLLGSLLFAKSLNRTLILPPFIHYAPNRLPELVPFDDIIQIEPIQEYHDVILLADFMSKQAAYDWPLGERRFYCYSARDSKSENLTCDALRGQPFNTFWSGFNVTEDSSFFYRPLITSHHLAAEWNKMFPSFSHRVLAFVGAPSSFPTHKDSIRVQKYIKLSEEVEEEALLFKKTKNFLDKPYLSMHIRHGSDWKRACEILRDNQDLDQLFSSNQCTGYGLDNLRQNLQFDTCLPSFETITKKLNESLQSFKTQQNIDIQIVHIATDHQDKVLWQKLRYYYPHIYFVITSPESDTMRSTMVDIYLMAHSNAFIGNCISSFSAFPARIRSEQLHLGYMNSYFGQKFSKTKQQPAYDEL